MYETKKKKSVLPPIVRLSVINPFLSELRNRGFSARQLLVDMELPPGVPASPDIFVPVATMYKLVEATAATAEDRCFGFMGIKIKEAYIMVTFAYGYADGFMIGIISHRC